METLDQQPLLSRAELQQRLARMIRRTKTCRRNEVTIYDLARFLGVSQPLLFNCSRDKHISDELQVRLSQVFRLLDTGQLRIAWVSRTSRGRPRKLLLRVVGPTQLTVPTRQPYVDLQTLKLRWD